MSSATALLVLAAEEAESSKTLFYVAGGGLAVWALLVSGLGMAKPDFPGSDGAAKGVYGISAALMVFAAVAAIVTG